LNRVAILLGVWSNTPWWIVPYYTIATWVGMWGTRFRIDKASLKGMFQLGMDQGFMSSDFWSRVASQWGLLPLFEMDSVLWLKKGKGIDLPDSTKLNSLGGFKTFFSFYFIWQ